MYAWQPIAYCLSLSLSHIIIVAGILRCLLIFALSSSHWHLFEYVVVGRRRTSVEIRGKLVYYLKHNCGGTRARRSTIARQIQTLCAVSKRGESCWRRIDWWAAITIEVEAAGEAYCYQWTDRKCRLFQLSVSHVSSMHSNDWSWNRFDQSIMKSFNVSAVDDMPVLDTFVERLSPTDARRAFWRDIQVGDILCVQIVSCDVIGMIVRLLCFDSRGHRRQLDWLDSSGGLTIVQMVQLHQGHRVMWGKRK